MTVEYRNWKQEAREKENSPGTYQASEIQIITDRLYLSVMCLMGEG